MSARFATVGSVAIVLEGADGPSRRQSSRLRTARSARSFSWRRASRLFGVGVLGKRCFARIQDVRKQSRARLPSGVACRRVVELRNNTPQQSPLVPAHSAILLEMEISNSTSACRPAAQLS